MNDTFNIIILDQFENFVEWLNPEDVTILETNKSNTTRTITLTYPLYNHSKNTGWWKQGNKIWITNAPDLKDCLYVINTDFSIDFWDNNKIDVAAEEVLTELNNLEGYAYASSQTIKIGKAALTSFFGAYYNIGTVEIPQTESLQSICPVGTMTRMELLRFIEEQTGNVFITEYTEKDHHITRTLHFLRKSNVGKEYKHPLDLNFNMDNLEYSVDESDTFTAMMPKLGSTTSVTTTTDTEQSGVINDTTTDTSLTTLQTTINDWRNLSVVKGSQIPLIIKISQGTDTSNADDTTEDTTDEEEGTVASEITTTTKTEYLAYWNAPFTKLEGDLYIIDESPCGVNYDGIRQVSTNNTVFLHEKIGTCTSSQTNPYAIYNVCANALLNKRYPNITIKVTVKDIEAILEREHHSFQVYDILYVKIPNFHEYIPVEITETTKNPHQQGDNTITLSTAVNIKNIQKSTCIKAKGTTLPAGTNTIDLSGTLTLLDGTQLKDQLITIDIEKVVAAEVIDNPDTTEENTNPPTGTFDPTKYEYTFTATAIEDAIRRNSDYIENNNKRPDYTTITDTLQNTYKLNYSELGNIILSYRYHYIEENTQPKSIIINNDPNNGYTWYKTRWASHKDITEYYNYLDLSGAFAHEWQGNITAGATPTCASAVISELSQFTKYYKTEEEVNALIKAGGHEPTATRIYEIVKKMGLKAKFVRYTQANFAKYIQVNSAIMLFVDASRVPWDKKLNPSLKPVSGHALGVIGTQANSDGTYYLTITDPGLRGYYPGYKKEEIVFNPEFAYKMTDLKDALILGMNTNGTVYDFNPGNDGSHTPAMLVIGTREFN